MKRDPAKLKLVHVYVWHRIHSEMNQLKITDARKWALYNKTLACECGAHVMYTLGTILLDLHIFKQAVMIQQRMHVMSLADKS